jgi:hypothetical protein
MSDIERDRIAMQFAITVVRSIEGEYPEHAGVREGEATSDVLAAILVRLERDAANPETFFVERGVLSSLWRWLRTISRNRRDIREAVR